MPQQIQNFFVVTGLWDRPQKGVVLSSFCHHRGKKRYIGKIHSIQHKTIPTGRFPGNQTRSRTALSRASDRLIEVLNSKRTCKHRGENCYSTRPDSTRTFRALSESDPNSKFNYGSLIQPWPDLAIADPNPIRSYPNFASACFTDFTATEIYSNYKICFAMSYPTVRDTSDNKNYSEKTKS